MISKSAYNKVQQKIKAEKEAAAKKVAAGTYIVVYISEQRLDYIQNGALKFTTPVTTGKNVSPTPKGTYYIRGKYRNTNLSGYNESGAWYSRPVSYWMPFIGNSYGIHDASWRSYFGGADYTWNGSMGCINVPTWKMGTLYNMVGVGTKLIIK